jgi:hypothetical protein
MIKLKKIFEFTFPELFRKTPPEYQERAGDVRAILKTKTPKGSYHYRTITSSNGHQHNQWVKGLPGKRIQSMNDDIILWCDCENFTYEDEWLLWRKNTSHVVNSNGQPLRVRNPEQIPKLCKHLIAVMNDLKRRI